MKRALLITATATVLAASGCATSDSANRSDASDDADGARTVASGPIDGWEVAARAERFNLILRLPTFETKAMQIGALSEFAMNDADRKLDALGALRADEVTFENTIRALDGISHEVQTTLNRHYLIQETSSDAELRDAARASTVAISNWYTEVQYREDVYAACKAFADKHSTRGLSGEDKKLITDTMLDYTRAGMSLEKATRDRVASLQKELTGISTQFSANNSNAEVIVSFTRDELAGVPDNFLEQWDAGDGTFAVKASVTPQFATVMTNASSEATRKKMKIARYSVNQEVNATLLNDMVRIRDEMGQLLGYSSWADYRTETRMAGSGENAEGFLLDLIGGLEPKFRGEMETFRAMKAADTGDADAEIYIWDWRYYANKLLKDEYNVDTEELRNYFPLENVIAGAFGVYGEVFGLTFEPVEMPQKWDETLQLWLCSDAATGEPLGLMYLDLYPRANKYGHYAQFPIVGGKLLEDGTYQRPVCALVCNFPAPSGDRPSLLSFGEVETFFHELGHALHTMLTTASHGRYAGTGVPRDFVEAPSQMLENWVREPAVLNRFAADWRDPSKKVPADILAAMDASEKATVGTTYRRQMALALGDMRAHKSGRYKDVGRIVNDTFTEVFLPVPEGTDFSAYWGHLAGYDAGYYGYAWADSIAADMATVFENAPNRYLDVETGMRLRKEIYSVGGSREIDESVRRFLGRERSLDAFLANLGIE